jgi:hypothetical protein
VVKRPIDAPSTTSMRRDPTRVSPPTQGDDRVPSLREALRELFAVIHGRERPSAAVI